MDTCLSLRSLSFLTAAPHLASSLTALTLDDCPALPLRDLYLVYHLPALERLAIIESFDAPLDAFALQSLTPDSLVVRRCMPNLKEFHYEPTPEWTRE